MGNDCGLMPLNLPGAVGRGARFDVSQPGSSCLCCSTACSVNLTRSVLSNSTRSTYLMSNSSFSPVCTYWRHKSNSTACCCVGAWPVDAWKLQPAVFKPIRWWTGNQYSIVYISIVLICYHALVCSLFMCTCVKVVLLAWALLKRVELV